MDIPTCCPTCGSDDCESLDPGDPRGCALEERRRRRALNPPYSASGLVDRPMSWD